MESMEKNPFFDPIFVIGNKIQALNFSGAHAIPSIIVSIIFIMIIFIMMILIPYGYIVVIGIFYYKSFWAKIEEARSFINTEDPLNHLPIIIEWVVYAVLTLLFGILALPFWIIVFSMLIFTRFIKFFLKKE